jgi:hypothetical protein
MALAAHSARALEHSAETTTPTGGSAGASAWDAPSSGAASFRVQIAADTKSQVIVGVDVTNKGSDLGEMSPMVEQVFERHGIPPDEVLVDGGFAKK